MHTIRIGGSGLHWTHWSPVAAVAVIGCFALEACTSGSEEMQPKFSQMLAITQGANGVAQIDFATEGRPLEEAQQCVRTRSGPVSCMAFEGDTARQFSRPVAAGDFKGPLCWVARWSRNAVGAEDGGYPKYRDPSCPTRWYDANGVVVHPSTVPGLDTGEPVVPADEVALELLATRCFRGPQPDPKHGDPDDLTCKGTVRNVSKQALDAAKVKVRFRLPDGREVDDGVRLDTLPLPSGGRSTFEITYYSAPKGKVMASFWFETFGGQPIAHRAARSRGG